MSARQRHIAQPDDFRLLVESVRDHAVLLIDASGRVLSWNAGAEAITGYQASEMIGRSCSVFHLPEARDAMEVELKKAAREGHFSAQGWRVRKDGSRFWAQVASTPLFAANDELRGFCVVTTDLTERRAAEQRLRESEERFRLMVEGVREYALYVLDREGRVASWNAGAERLLGWRLDEILGRDLSTFYIEQDRAAAKAGRELEIAAAEGSVHDEGWRVRKDGSRFWAKAVLTALRDDRGALIGYAKLVRSSQRTLEVLDTISDGFIAFDANWRFTYANPRGAEFTRRPVEELLGKDVWELQPELKGTEIERRYLAAVETQRPAEFEYHDRGNARWLDVHAYPARAGGLWVFLRDITDRKQMEEGRARVLELEQGARMAAEQASRAKDEFLAMLGHELRNPLAPIVTALQLMKLRGDVRSTKEQDIIERQVYHLIRLVDDLLDISRITRGKVELNKQLIDLRDVVARAVEMASPLLEQRRHHFDVQVPRQGMRVDGDPERLAQVVANLLTNAAKYTEPGGHITLKARREPCEVVLEVKDDGVGISEDLLPRVFELFVQGWQSPERAAGGLGIGLALVRNLVEMHGGRVTAASDGHRRGSVFTVRLPAPAGEAGQPAIERAAGVDPVKPLAARRVLIVDDNEDALVLLTQLLGESGHEVVAAHDGPSALEAVKKFRPDVAVLDIGLPVMDGYELAARLRSELGDALHLIALTGYGQEHDRVRSKASGFAVHLVKPVDARRLLDTIDRCTAHSL